MKPPVQALNGRLFYCRRKPQYSWGFQKAFVMHSSNPAESLPCVRGGVTVLSRDGGVVLIATIPQSPLCGDSPLYTRGPVHTTGTAGGYD